LELNKASADIDHSALVPKGIKKASKCAKGRVW
jgi:hypothetical protein